MQAVILAGGLGTRLRPVTEKIPKAMVSVGGRPFLRYLLELLACQKITDILLCVGYLGNQIESYFGDGRNLSLKIIYHKEKGELLGTGGALKQAASLMAEHCLVLNGDTYLPINYNDMISAYFERGKKALTAIYTNRENTGVKSNLAISGENVVTKYDKIAADPELKYVEAGALIIQREVLSLISHKYPISIEKSLYPALIDRGELGVYVTNQRFYDIGTPEQLGIFEEFLKKRNA